MKTAIIGAGLSGSYLYSLLRKDGHDVTIFEKSRGAGGRCSTRYIHDKLIDHGTPYFQASNETFIEFCENLVKENILKKENTFYIPKNGMNKICSHLLTDNDFEKNTQIISCEFIKNKWHLKTSNGIKYDGFDKIFITIPAPQAIDLFQAPYIETDIISKLKKVTYESIATLMIYSYEGATIDQKLYKESKIFKKIIDNSSKYDYNNFTSYVLHLDPKLTSLQKFQNKDEIKTYMLELIHKKFSQNLEDQFHILPHFWKYGFVSHNIELDSLYDNTLGLGFCGDYFQSKDLQGAYLSALHIYDTIQKE
jgi:renalase